MYNTKCTINKNWIPQNPFSRSLSEWQLCRGEPVAGYRCLKSQHGLWDWHYSNVVALCCAGRVLLHRSLDHLQGYQVGQWVWCSRSTLINLIFKIIFYQLIIRDHLATTSRSSLINFALQEFGWLPSKQGGARPLDGPPLCNSIFM